MLQRSNIEMRLGRHPPSEEDYGMSTQSKSKAAPKAVDVTAEAYEQVVESTKAQVEKANEVVVKGYDEFAALQKEGVDALIKAGAIWAKKSHALSWLNGKGDIVNCAAVAKIFGKAGDRDDWSRLRCYLVYFWIVVCHYRSLSGGWLSRCKKNNMVNVML